MSSDTIFRELPLRAQQCALLAGLQQSLMNNFCNTPRSKNLIKHRTLLSPLPPLHAVECLCKFSEYFKCKKSSETKMFMLHTNVKFFPSLFFYDEYR